MVAVDAQAGRLQSRASSSSFALRGVRVARDRLVMLLDALSRFVASLEARDHFAALPDARDRCAASPTRVVALRRC